MLKAIIISGMPAVGKTTVSRHVANELGLKVVGGGDVLKEMAIEEGYRPGGDDWWDTQDGMKFLAERNHESGFDKEVDRRLREKVEDDPSRPEHLETVWGAGYRFTP